MRFRCTRVEGTASAAGALADCVPETGLVLGLIGPLGAGKTAFVKGLAAGLGLDPRSVSSPTFVIANQYLPATSCGRGLAHVDLYRLATSAELDDIGFADLLEPGAVVAVEWADRLPDALPRDRIELRIERDDHLDANLAAKAGESRTFVASATGRGSQTTLEAWQLRLAGLPHVETL